MEIWIKGAPNGSLTLSDVKITPERVREFLEECGFPLADGDWLNVLHGDAWKGKIYHLYVNVGGEKWSVQGIIRRPTVDVVVTVSDGKRTYVLFTEQYRELYRAKIVANPAGGIDSQETAEEAARREAAEETGLPPASLKLKALGKPVAASPGTIKEEAHFFLAKAQLSSTELDAYLERWKNTQQGLAEEGERITIIPVLAVELKRFVSGLEPHDAKMELGLSRAGLC
ncbi:MAG TPA: NUDIX domain-containing protein [Verrucomicrobiae bacterium]|nr:NUDIX domain-containing protein [Verrucomicrobiae bacterium]